MKTKTDSNPFPPDSIIKVIGWGLILFLAFYFIIRNAIPHYSLDPNFYGHHWSHAGMLLVHITGGILALLVGPLQFWTGLKRRNMHLHKWSGRVYLGAVGISVLSASYILTIPESDFGFRIGIAGLAFAWIITTTLAYLAIRRKNVLQHKEWMIRSYVVTFGFVFFRLLFDLMLGLNIASPQEIVSAVSWLCWAPPLLLTEMLIQGNKILVSRHPIFRTER